MDIAKARGILANTAYNLRAGRNPGKTQEEEIKSAFDFLINRNDFDFLFNTSALLKTEPYGEKALETIFRKSSQTSPENVLQNRDLLEGKTYRDAVLETAFRKLAVDSPYAVLQYHNLIKGKPCEEEVLKVAFFNNAKLEPYDILTHPEMLKGKPYGDSVLETAFRNSAASNPAAVLGNSSLLEGKPYKEEVLDSALRKSSPDDILEHANLLKGKTYGPALLENAFRKEAQSFPRDVLVHADLLKGKPYEAPILETAFRNSRSPDAILLYAPLLAGRPYKDELIESAFRKAAETDPFIVLDYANLLEGKPYEPAVWHKMASSEKGALEIVKQINFLHEAPDVKRFANLKHFVPLEEFDLITLGRQEAYTSSYNGILDSMLGKLTKDKEKLTDVIGPEQQDRMAIFLEAAASYNRMNDVLKFIPQDKLPGIVHDLVDHAAKAKDLRYLLATADMMALLKGNDQMRHLLETEVKDHFDHAGSTEEKTRFGLLASAYAKNASAISPDMKSFFLGAAANPAYTLPTITEMRKDQLIDNKGANNQLMVFADDEDSKASFNNWKATYANKAGWKIEDKGSYVHIVSTGGNLPVHIYANTPGKLDEGIAAINKEVAARQGSNKAAFQVFIGRGHSTHADEYIKLIDSNMKLIVLGSCGGYQNLEKVYGQSPNAQVICTKQRGNTWVNDIILSHLSESINRDGSITWSKEQQTLDAQGSSDKEGYVLPNREVSFLMLKRYHELEAKEGKGQGACKSSNDISIGYAIHALANHMLGLPPPLPSTSQPCKER